MYNMIPCRDDEVRVAQGVDTNGCPLPSKCVPKKTSYCVDMPIPQCIGGGIVRIDDTARGCYYEKCGTVSAPVINGFSGPVTLGVGAQGTWVVQAKDPNNGQLSYMVRWGDENVPHFDMLLSAYPQDVFTQTSSFTHAYLSPGTYTVAVTVRTASGASAQTTATVVVTSAPISTSVFTADPSQGAAPLTVQFSGAVSSAGYSIDFGDGNGSGDVGCANGGCPMTLARTPVQSTHTYTAPGEYIAKLRAHAPINAAACAGVDCNVVGKVRILVTSGKTCANVAFAPVCGTPSYCLVSKYANGAVPSECQYGKTYANECAMKAEGAILKSQGRCEVSGTGRCITYEQIAKGSTDYVVKEYNEGDSVSCITPEKPQVGVDLYVSRQCIADAAFVCRSGQWKVEGGLQMFNQGAAVLDGIRWVVDGMNIFAR